MEDVLDLYHEPYDADAPVVCLDETSKQLVAETRVPLPPERGRKKRFDYEYERCGVANLFMINEPLANWRHVRVTEQRTRIDFAETVRELLDEHYPDAPRVRLVLDNLNTHSIASLYEAFPPAEARRLAARLEIHYTPKHGSWLNMAEIELAVLAKQCLSQRIGTAKRLQAQIAAWESDRNNAGVGVKWQFTTDDARVKLHRLYPQIQA